MMTFTRQEIDYLQSQKLARVSTVAPDGQPDVVPVGYTFDGHAFWIGGYNPTTTRRTRNIQAGNSKVALVVDDLAPGGWHPRSVRVYGTAELREKPAGSGTLVMRVTPEVSWSMNLDGSWSPESGAPPATRKTKHR